MADVGANLLEHEGGVALAHDVVEQGVGVRQKEAVLLLIELAHLLIQVVEQADVVHIAQGELARVDDSVVLASEILGGLEQRYQFLFRQFHHGMSVRGGLGGPVLGTLQVFLHGGIADVIARVSVQELVEVAGYARLLPVEVVHAQAVHIE